MGTIANLLIKVGVDVNDAQRDMAAFGGRTGKGLRKALVPAGAALLGLGLAAKAGFGEFVDAQKVTAQTEAVLKSTGGVANVTANDIGTLSESLMRKSGIDDEAIASGANMLLTFTKVRNEVGKGNDVFNQATTAALDMSVAMGTDMKSSSMLVGKALNDPIKGMTALSRAGIQFTEGQKKAIKAMVASGNTMGAQKMILKELKTQFGGSAEAAGTTLSGQLNIARETFLNLAGSIVGAALPAFTAFAGILNRAASFLSKHETATKVLLGVIGGLAAAVVVANAALKLHAAAVIVAAAAKKVATGATKAYAAAQWLLNAAMRANPLGIVITALVAIAAAIVVAYKNSETFRRIVDASFKAVLSVVTTVWNWIKGNWPLLLAILTGPIGIAVTLIIKNFDKIKPVVNAVKAVIGTVADIVTSVKNTVGQAVTSIIGNWDKVKAPVNAVKTAIQAVDAAVDAVKIVIGNAVTSIVGNFNKMDGPVNATRSAVDAVKSAVQALKNSPILAGIGAAFSAGFAGAKAAVQGVLSAVNGLISAIQTAISWVSKLSGNSARAHAQARALQGLGGAGGGIPATANGGIFNGAQVRLIGEAGPEAVVPLNRPRRAAEILSEAGLMGAGGPSVHIDTMVVQDATDIDRVAMRLGRQLMMAG